MEVHNDASFVIKDSNGNKLFYDANNKRVGDSQGNLSNLGNLACFCLGRFDVEDNFIIAKSQHGNLTQV